VIVELSVVVVGITAVVTCNRTYMCMYRCMYGRIIVKFLENEIPKCAGL